MKESITKADTLKIIINKCEVHFPEIFLRASEHEDALWPWSDGELKVQCQSLLSPPSLIGPHLWWDKAQWRGTCPRPTSWYLSWMWSSVKGNCATEDKAWEVLNVTGIYSGMNHTACWGAQEAPSLKILWRKNIWNTGRCSTLILQDLSSCWSSELMLKPPRLRSWSFWPKLMGLTQVFSHLSLRMLCKMKKKAWVRSCHYKF